MFPVHLEFRFGSGLLLFHSLLEDLSQDLPCCTLWNLIQEADSSSQLLVMGHLGIHPVDDLLGGCIGSLHSCGRYDVCPGDLIVVLVYSNDSDVADLWM